MNQLKGLYISLILIMFVNLTNFSFFDGNYSGIAMMLSVTIFFIATLFYINASHRMKDTEQ
ncbi:hypothetical protein [Planomicrobium sp. Y74]|uniref:hypothetical protein n=1 Tax=Planomicrobium sp. Y74 TaxID=2478977 RepID=UPI000EF4FD26|nr:hypothetical protein [Planomicrobium sp. Y74]RLQ91271.1 hypothetical protein D9754_05965 [Planomicrobium sp. Y74]